MAFETPEMPSGFLQGLSSFLQNFGQAYSSAREKETERQWQEKKFGEQLAAQKEQFEFEKEKFTTTEQRQKTESEAQIKKLNAEIESIKTKTGKISELDEVELVNMYAKIQNSLAPIYNIASFMPSDPNITKSIADGQEILSNILGEIKRRKQPTKQPVEQPTGSPQISQKPKFSSKKYYSDFNEGLSRIKGGKNTIEEVAGAFANTYGMNVTNVISLFQGRLKKK